MLKTFRTLLNIFSFFFLVIGALSFGIESVFNVHIFNALLGPALSTFVTYLIGLNALYGVHLFIEYTKLKLGGMHPEKTKSEHYIEQDRTYED